MTGINILGAEIDGLDMVETICCIDNYIKLGRESRAHNEKKKSAEDARSIVHHIITLNAEILYNAQSDEELMRIIKKADLITPDGSGTVWGIKQLTGRDVDRVTGIDLMTEICRQSKSNDWKVFLFGGKPGIADEAGRNLEDDYGTKIAGMLNGYFSDEDEASIVERINDSDTDVLFVALGAPKQEIWIDKYRDVLNVPVVIGVGGSFDVISGQVERAPQFFQKMGLEWLWRLIKEPWRWKRMMALPKFMLLIKRTKRKKLV
ncbi:MAG: WecB/TagA/CpsF family glycosyltransferase [Bacillota bacterium]|jgi:N-acetylglucosaminyldiphosphoundecaprenol N-acetyl-beta-D-mannosaminyltransferase